VNVPLTLAIPSIISRASGTEIIAVADAEVWPDMMSNPQIVTMVTAKCVLHSKERLRRISGIQALPKRPIKLNEANIAAQ
jgi:hypothetical protein